MTSGSTGGGNCHLDQSGGLRQASGQHSMKDSCFKLTHKGGPFRLKILATVKLCIKDNMNIEQWANLISMHQLVLLVCTIAFLY